MQVKHYNYMYDLLASQFPPFLLLTLPLSYLYPSLFFSHFFFTLVPINITAKPPPSQTIEGIQNADFSVTFTGRPTQNITTTWYHEANLFESNEDIQLETTFPDSRHGVASIIFPAIARGHSGVYRVEIETEFGAEVISLEHRMQVVAFQLDVEGTYTCMYMYTAIPKLVWDLAYKSVATFELNISHLLSLSSHLTSFLPPSLPPSPPSWSPQFPRHHPPTSKRQARLSTASHCSGTCHPSAAPCTRMRRQRGSWCT